MMPSPEELGLAFLLDGGESAPVIRLGSSDSHGLPTGPVCIAIGAFDGVHRGHRELLAATVRDARERGAAALAVTFDPDPDQVLPGTPAPKLMAPADRLGELARSGVDGVAVIPFTGELARLDYRVFLEDVLGRDLDLASIHIGRDFKLGYQGLGSVGAISRWSRPRGIDVVAHELVSEGERTVSATRIRAALAQGRVEEAAVLLGRPYMLRSRVDAGRGEGSGMGFPTANLVVSPQIQVPADGVYEGLALVDGTVYPAAVNVGLPPMFADSSASAHMEANLIGFTGDLYGRNLSLAFTRFLRKSRVFLSRDELIRTVRGNIADITADLGREGVRLK